MDNVSINLYLYYHHKKIMNNNLTSPLKFATAVLPQNLGNFQFLFHSTNYDHYRNAINATTDLVQEFLNRNKKRKKY